MKKDNLDHQINNFPKKHMSQKQKELNWQQIRQYMQKPTQKKNWLAYPLTALVFGLFMLFVFLTVGDHNMVEAPEQENPMIKYASTFEGHEPFVDISHVKGEDQSGYELSIVAGYLFNASDFLKEDFSEMNPIKSPKPVDEFLKELFSDVGKNQLYSTKKTWVYLNSAKQILNQKRIKEQYDTKALLEKIDEWILKLEKINDDNSFKHNVDLYKEVVEELTYLVRSIQNITPDSVIYAGKSKSWEIHLQYIGGDNPLDIDGENYLITFTYSGQLYSEDEGLGRVEFIFKDGQKVLRSSSFSINGVGGTYLNYITPAKLENVDHPKITIHWMDGKAETVELAKEIY